MIALTDRIIQSAACAASGGYRRANAADAVREALQQGVRATRHGRALPLPVLLDVFALLKSPIPGQMPERTSNATPQVRAYDRWLGSLAEVIHGRFGAQRQGFDGLPLILHAWEGGADGDPRAWERAYQALLSEDAKVEAICQRWIGPRQLTTDGWDWCQLNGTDPFSDLDHGLLWSVFQREKARAPGDWVEWFDHAAAHFYLRSRNAALLADQIRLIELLKHRARWMESTPFTTAYEDADPRYGVPPLSAYVPEELDEIAHRLLNHQVIYLNSLPPVRPPPTLQVHLCWVAASESVHREIDLLAASESSPGHPPMCFSILPAMASQSAAWETATEGRIAQASLLQAIVGMMLDDWRFFLQMLPVRFHVHRGFPQRRRVEAIRPGRRWKETLRLHNGALPRSDVVNLLFQTQSYVDSVRAVAPWQGLPLRRGAWSWWCLCLLADDLASFGIEHRVTAPANQPERQTLGLGPMKDDIRFAGVPGWIARRQLPSAFSHVLIVNPATGAGEFCALLHGSSGLELRPKAKRGGSALKPGVPFCLERHAALDALLEECLRWLKR